MDWGRVSLAVSVMWLMVLIFRMAVYAMPYASTPEGRLFSTVLNILLVVGILVVGYSLFKRFFQFAAAKTMKATHCPQCYSKVEPGAEFCPRCGRQLRRFLSQR